MQDNHTPTTTATAERIPSSDARSFVAAVSIPTMRFAREMLVFGAIRPVGKKRPEKASATTAEH
jgi:hypothetical protein